MSTLLSRKMLIILSVVALVVFVLVMLLFFDVKKAETTSSSDWGNQKVVENVSPSQNITPMGTTAKVASIDTLVDGLRERLEKQPDDVKGWVLLSRSYHHLQRWDDAKYAMDKAKALGYDGEAQPLDNMPKDQIHQGAVDNNSMPQNATINKSLIEHIENIQ